ncbi:hypothetical protein ABH935_005174 [Catenulispora sp. GAS73]|uniref:hypothetical protein n=1 Tax=Catenulispora sp. GAS73 TaxID=3156269 RepID=UPI00351612FA
MGPVVGHFEVDIHYGEFGGADCGPIDKHGDFTADDGSTIHVEAVGSLCKTPTASPAGQAWYVNTRSNVASTCAPFAGAAACADGIAQHAADATAAARPTAVLLVRVIVVSPSGIRENRTGTDVRSPVQTCAGPAHASNT